ncbi:hypothetical protein Sjap_024103 [Stephania japonica]|uniref:2-oxoacid dehydrogenase acyltransferase catalytic domain-containing protein n=1 Tax=Stephania japonica TaxID=461633 RepID=A0AAP0ECU7_9MAGN
MATILFQRTYGDMDQNTRDVIMGILLTESSKAAVLVSEHKEGNSEPSSIPHNLEYLRSDQRVVLSAGPDRYTFASYMSVTLSCDHRVIDGA